MTSPAAGSAKQAAETAAPAEDAAKPTMMSLWPAEAVDAAKPVWEMLPSWTTVAVAGFGASVGLVVAGAAIRRRRRLQLEARPTVLTINLNAPIVTVASPREKLAALFGRPTPLEFGEVLYALRKAGPDPAVKAVVARTGRWGELDHMAGAAIPLLSLSSWAVCADHGG